MTVFSVDLTVPSLFVLLVVVFETSRSHATSRNDNAKVDIATQITVIRFFIFFSIPFLSVITLAFVSVVFCFVNGKIRHGLDLHYGV